MRELIPDIERWRADGKGIALATVVKAWGSSPRPLGSRMAISDGGDMAGSVSGGCVEGAVYEEAQGVLRRSAPKLLTFGVTNEEAWAVGLSCGGEIQVFVEPVELMTLYPKLVEALGDERLVALATVVAGPETGAQLLIAGDGEAGRAAGTLGAPELDRAVIDAVAEVFASQSGTRLALEQDGQAVDVFLDVLPPRKTLIVVGAVHVAIPLISFANTLGFRTVVVDPRTAFATRERFPHADELDTEWPDRALERVGLNAASYVAVLSHDLKLDLPALAVALRSPARYVGALGSKKTHAKRVAALLEQGFTEAELARIHNPIGLPLGGRRAEEMAVAIIAEMVAASHGKAGHGKAGHGKAPLGPPRVEEDEPEGTPVS